MAFYLLETDGHNIPSFRKFLDADQAERWFLWRHGDYAGEVEGMEGEVMRLGYFEYETSWIDPDGTLWTVMPSPTLFIADHTDWQPNP